MTICNLEICDLNATSSGGRWGYYLQNAGAKLELLEGGSHIVECSKLMMPAGYNRGLGAQLPAGSMRGATCGGLRGKHKRDTDLRFSRICCTSRREASPNIACVSPN